MISFALVSCFFTTEGAVDFSLRRESSPASAAAYSALVALQLPAREAVARADDGARARISSASLDALLLLDTESSEVALRRIVALSHFDLGTAASEVYGCMVIRKGQAIVPYIEQELERPGNPCASEFGEGSSVCRPARDVAGSLRFFVSQIVSGQPCEIVP
jgi:hypothetical protein